MKFKTKLYVGLGSTLAFTALLVFILLYMLNQLTVNMNSVVNDMYERVKMTSILQNETNNMGRELREIASDPPENILLALVNEWEESHVNIKTAVEFLEKMDNREKSQELLVKFNTLYERNNRIGEQVISFVKVEKETDFEELLWNDAKLTQQRMIQIADLLHTLQEQEMKDELYRTRKTHNIAVQIIYAYVMIGLIMGICAAILLIRGLTSNLQNVSSVMSSVTYTHNVKLPRIHMNSKDEIGEIAEAFNEMAHKLEEHAAGEKELKEKAEEQSWLQSKVARIATMYPEAENLQDLAHMLITKLTPMVDASFGVFYLKESKYRKPYLRKIASYAFNQQNVGFKGFSIGEGLVGQCAAEKRTILLTDLPDNYVKIGSGLGGASPMSAIILPIEFEGEVLAVIELASFQSFSFLQQKLLKEIISNIGITVNNIENHMKVEKLLHESQSLTEELQNQSEELQMQQEELRLTNEKLEEQYASSEQKKRELERIRLMLEEKAQQLEASSQYKSEFLANMSHELRTPLNSLLILAQMLAENSQENLTEKQVDYVRTIFSSGQDLLHLINDILDLAKVEAGKLEIVSGKVMFEQIKEEVENQFLPLANKKGLSLNIQLDPNLSSSFYTDKRRLLQIIKNLLSNSLKFTNKGEISMIVKNVMIPSRAHKNHSMIAFSISDTGIGISKDKQTIIFDAFKQADGTTSRKYGGTGLGLSISRELAQLLDGFIEVKSEEGQGSTFTLYIPNNLAKHVEELVSSKEEAAVSLALDEPEEEVEEKKTEGKIVKRDKDDQKRKALFKGKKILIIDDDMRNVFALTTALEKYEMDVIFAENGKEGIELLQENPQTDLVFMDIMMPEMDGFEAMRHIRQIKQFNKLPIIALTAKAMKHNRERCIEAGASDYISKPVNIEQLFSLLHVWLYR
jgi:two-component system, chemotaxis family, sensor kinase CheA